MNKPLYKERRGVEKEESICQQTWTWTMMHLFVNTETSAAVQELNYLSIFGLIRTKTLLNAYTMIFKIDGCLFPIPWSVFRIQCFVYATITQWLRSR